VSSLTDQNTAPPGVVLRTLDAVCGTVNRAMAWLAGIALVVMMLFTVGDVVLRSAGRPVAGSFEVIGWLSAVAMALSLGYVQLHRGHVAMTLITARLQGRALALLEVITSSLSLAMFAVVAWYVVRYGITLYETGSLSETLRVMVYPWVMVVGVGFFGLTLALLLDVVRAVTRLFSARSEPDSVPRKRF